MKSKKYAIHAEKSLAVIKKTKVKDLCHYTGKFRGATHSECNLKHKVLKEIPLVFHNGSWLSFYD